MANLLMMVPKKKLTDTQERLLVQRYQGGESLEVLSLDFDCAPGTVRNTLIRYNVVRRGPGRKAMPLSKTKLCSSCTRDLPRKAFYNEGRRSSECKDCLSEKAKVKYLTEPSFRQRKIEQAYTWALQNPEAARSRKRKWASGWDYELFERIWEKQKGQCLICEVPMLKTGTTQTSVCADHDHASGKPRGLLCRRCNLHLGIHEKYKDAFERYLQQYGGAL